MHVDLKSSSMRAGIQRSLYSALCACEESTTHIKEMHFCIELIRVSSQRCNFLPAAQFRRELPLCFQTFTSIMYFHWLSVKISSSSTSGDCSHRLSPWDKTFVRGRLLDFTKDTVPIIGKQINKSFWLRTNPRRFTSLTALTTSTIFLSKGSKIKSFENPCVYLRRWHLHWLPLYCQAGKVTIEN